MVDLARVEWAWLESYHAVEAIPLRLADLAGLNEDSLLCVCIASHPSVRTIRFEAPPLKKLMDEIPDIADALDMLIARP